MDLTNLKMAVIVTVSALMAIAYLAMVLQRNTQKGYRLEVEPKTAVVVKDLWSGKTEALFAGSHTLRPGRDKVVQTVSLKDEPSDPPIMQVTTSDRIELGVNIVIHEQRVLDYTEDKTAVLRAALNIDYAQRTTFVLARIAACLQKIFIELKLEQVYKDNGIDKAQAIEIENNINEYLKKEVTEPWGIKVVVKFQDLVLPARLMETAEESETAVKKGKATNERAIAAGVDPTVAYIGEVLVDAIAAFKGHGGKEGGK